MIESLCILGRQPAIGIAELESLYGSEPICVINDEVVGLKIPIDKIDFERLGGTIKLCRVIGVIDNVSWVGIEQALLSNPGKYITATTSGKLQFGLSAYQLSVSVKQIQATGIKLKKVLKGAGQSVRLVPNQLVQLNSAQVLHNRLYNEKGIELILVKDKNRTIVARTTAVQDISSYTFRDRSRPKRDSRVGMLPPKLAQIIVNLAATADGDTILDPFCGTGVVLQEAALMGYRIYGTDIEPRMVEYSHANLEWLKHHFGRPKDWILENGDATDYNWQNFNAVASEVYLGQPFSAFPSEEKLRSVIHTCNQITENFLKNIYEQLRPSQRLCLAIPSWLEPKNSYFIHLPLLDHLESLGYNRVSFSHARNQDLIYYRPGQIVGRELIVIKRN